MWLPSSWGLHLLNMYAWLRPDCQECVSKATEIPVVREFIGDQPGDILEIGYGRALYLDWMTRNAKSYVGVDVIAGVPFRARIALRRNPAIFFASALGGALPFPSESFDTVLSTQVLEHVIDDDSFLGEVRRVLKRGGAAVIAVPVPPPPFPVELDVHGRGGHVRHGYTIEQLHSKLRIADLEPLTSRYAGSGFSRFALRARHALALPVPIALFVALAFLDRFRKIGASDQPLNIVVKARAL